MNLQKLEEIEKFLTQNGLIYFENYNYSNPITVEKFYQLFYKLNNEYDSIAAQPYLAPEDYNTDSGRDRSLRDIFLICKYYTGCTLKEFLEATHKEGVTGNVCRTIKKWLLFPKSRFDDYNLFERDESRPEFDGLSAQELYRLVDIELQKF
jgi:hypothetical protein